jgi:hypothetical protein
MKQQARIKLNKARAWRFKTVANTHDCLPTTIDTCFYDDMETFTTNATAHA